jgi:Flp pilus assembly protein TadB
MALSDHERKLLAEMEAAFAQEDPGLVSTLTGKARTRQGSRALLGTIIFLAGMAILFGGLVSKIITIGLLGFVVALVGAFLVITNLTIGRSKSERSQKNRPSFGDRLEQRWDRRNFDK